MDPTTQLQPTDDSVDWTSESVSRLWDSYEQRIGQPKNGLLDRMPDALVIAPAKTGSSWLYGMLRSHPDVFSPPVKETRYFCTRWRFHDIEWYLAHFNEGGSRCKVDVSPTYAALPERAIRVVHRLRPDLKLVVMVRDPASRGWSHLKHMWRYREGSFRLTATQNWPSPPDALRFGAVEDWPVINGSYAHIIRRWLSVFPREQMFVGVTELIERDPLVWMRQLCDFLGVNQSHAWSSELLSARINVGISGAPPDEIRDLLRLVYRQRTRDAVALLENLFGVAPTGEWTESLGILMREHMEIGEYRGYRIWVSKEGFAAKARSHHKAVLERGGFQFHGELTRAIDAQLNRERHAPSSSGLETALASLVVPPADPPPRQNKQRGFHEDSLTPACAACDDKAESER